MPPIDLIVDLGPAGWAAQYNRDEGIAVTARNWAPAYEISDAAAVSSGMRIACDAPSNATDAYSGAWSADCVVTIAAATVVYVSHLAPAANDARTGAANAIQRWLSTVRSG
jgi:hypothetical protein